MRKGMTLIELIFSMVIISIVFSIVPKIIFASNKSMELSMKEDALFNAYTLMGSITKLAWDENTLTDGKILATAELAGTSSDCASNDRKVGNLYGSRNCVDSTDSASSIGLETDDYNDIDDYDGYDENVSVNGKNRYSLSVAVNYVDDDYDNASTTDTKELKEIEVLVKSINNKTKGFESSFFYYSANLGHIQIKKELW